MNGGRDAHHFAVGASVESFGKHSHHEHVDQEGEKERDGRLDEEVLVGLFHLLLVRAVHLARLTQRRDISTLCRKGLPVLPAAALTLTSAEWR